jgi:hypothetical protein
MEKYYYGIMWLAIGIISSVDIYWSIVNQEILMEAEENPIGRYLIEREDGDIALFMAIKVAGTITALGILVILYHWNKRYAWPIIIALTVAQFWLLNYLNSVGGERTALEKERLKWHIMNTDARPVSIFSEKNSQ